MMLLPLPSTPTEWQQFADTLFGVFNYVPDTVFFIKDADRRYLHANTTLLERLHCPDLADLVGKRVEEVFPGALSLSYAVQDRTVLQGGRLVEHLELHLYPSGAQGWCLTTKQPLRDESGRIRALLGISRDVSLPAGEAGYARALRLIQEEYARPLSVLEIARAAGVSRATLQRQVKRACQLSPKQLLTRVRLDAGLRLLQTTDHTVGQIALECGYYDHSAFTRAFHAALGLTPAEYRALLQGRESGPDAHKEDRSVRP